MPPRLFSIISADGTETELNGPEYMAHSPSGLGISLNNDILQRDNVLYINTRELNLDEIELSIVFSDWSEKSPYENFLALSKKLAGGVCKLKYYIPRVGTYYKDVVVKKMTKTDYNGKNGLVEKISLEPISLWYQNLYYSNASSYDEEQIIMIEVDTTNIIEKVHKNEFVMFCDFAPEGEETTAITTPAWRWSYDSFNDIGQDSYNVTIDPPEAHYTYTAQTQEIDYIICNCIRAGNLDGVTYAYLEQYSAKKDIHRFYSHPKEFELLSQARIMHKENPNCKTPVEIREGTTYITIPQSGGYAWCGMHVKLENELV